MLMRFLVYGALGWVVEIVWTGLGSALRRDPRLTAKTYLWMFPIYGGGALFFERVYQVIAASRGLCGVVIWTGAILESSIPRVGLYDGPRASVPGITAGRGLPSTALSGWTTAGLGLS